MLHKWITRRIYVRVAELAAYSGALLLIFKLVYRATRFINDEASVSVNVSLE